MCFGYAIIWLQQFLIAFLNIRRKAWNEVFVPPRFFPAPLITLLFTDALKPLTVPLTAALDPKVIALRSVPISTVKLIDAPPEDNEIEFRKQRHQLLCC